MVAHDVSVTVHGPHGLKLDGKLAPGEVLEIGNVTLKADLGFTFVVPHTMAQEHGGKLPIQVRGYLAVRVKVLTSEAKAMKHGKWPA